MDLEPGSFLYQADQEIFLAVIEDCDDEVRFAVHGWRTIDKDRLESYLSAGKPVMHTEEQVMEVIDEADDPDAERKIEWLKEIFETYKKDVDETHEDFSLDDT